MDRLDDFTVARHNGKYIIMMRTGMGFMPYQHPWTKEIETFDSIAGANIKRRQLLHDRHIAQLMQSLKGREKP